MQRGPKWRILVSHGNILVATLFSSSEPSVQPPPAPAPRWIAASLFVLGMIYLLQLCSPLRLNTDAIVLLQMGRSASSGLGFKVDGRATQFPSGFPTLLAVLDRLHIACSASFIAINLLSLALALIAFCRVAQREWGIDRTSALAAIGLTLLSFPVIKHVTIPLTDLFYMALSLLALDAMTLSRQRVQRKVTLLILACVLTAAAISVRTIGIALLPSLAWSMMSRGHPRGYLDALRGSTWSTRVYSLASFLIVFLLLSRTAYGSALLHQLRSPSQFLKVVAFDRLSDAAQLLLNSPRLGPMPILMVVFAGPAAIALVVFGLVAIFQQGVTELYLVSFLGIFLFWPYADPRFEVPILPFLIVLMAAGAHSLTHLRKAQFGVIFYQTVYVLLGIAALAYSTKLSLAGDRFADEYGSDELRASYQFAFGRPINSATSQPLPVVVELLRRYDARAAQADHISGR